ncbi:hypothetical protein [Rossellomorea marisflavi]|uniref:hypothetical protein n=1 Tax=Rossellomorea marisflavi TaxID=189381 RepID=UPI003FA02B06
MGELIEGFQVKRYLHDYQSWVQQKHAETSLSSLQTADELVSFITNSEEGYIVITTSLLREMEMWMDVTVEEMVKTFKKHNIDSKSMLLFLRENQERYLERSHLVKCDEGHVHGLFPTDNGVDGDTLYCEYCEREFIAPEKMHQLVVYNWLSNHIEE